MQRIVYFEMDDTLVRSVGQKPIPMPAVIAQVHRLKEDGAILFYVVQIGLSTVGLQQ